MLPVLLAFLLGQPSADATATPPPAAPATCESPEHDSFDFWVGDWDVYPTGKDTIVAHSKIEKLYGGCAIRENWMPISGKNRGGSLSGYDPATGRWHQTWFGSAPGPVLFDGGIADSKMVLTAHWPGSGPNGEDGLTRMTYSLQDDGSVRQHGEFSGDYGLIWVTSFDFLYRPHRES